MLSSDHKAVPDWQAPSVHSPAGPLPTKGTGKDEPAAAFRGFRDLTKQITKVVSAASNKVQHKANF